jgi:hypothetical protein
MDDTTKKEKRERGLCIFFALLHLWASNKAKERERGGGGGYVGERRREREGEWCVLETDHGHTFFETKGSLFSRCLGGNK